MQMVRDSLRDEVAARCVRGGSERAEMERDGERWREVLRDEVAARCVGGREMTDVVAAVCVFVCVFV